MNNATLAQATLLALTMQNQAFKVAPLSTATMSGMCINRNIAVGETVCCYYNDEEQLLRVGNVPSYSGNYFVDDNNLVYSRNQDRLIIKNGLSGDIIDDTIDAYDFIVYAGGACAAYRMNSGDIDETWKVILPDGTITENEIVVPYQSVARHHTFGYRNGIIGLFFQTSSTTASVKTFTANGTPIAELKGPRGVYPNADVVCPINSTTVCCLTWPGALWDEYCYYTIHTLNDYTAIRPWADLVITSGHVDEVTCLGVDQSYIYAVVQYFEEVDGQYESAGFLVSKLEIDDYSRMDMQTYQDTRTWYSMSSSKGSIIQKLTVNGETVTRMLDLSTLEQIYEDDLQSLPETSQVRENDGWIWIPGSGVYQKRKSGWLMYSTDEYPRSSPWGKLGYAIRNVKVGQEGLAIVLFE